MLWEHVPSWHVAAFIIKTGDDLRQEELAMQLLRVCACAFAAEGLGVRMFVYDIVAVAAQAGALHSMPASPSTLPPSIPQPLLRFPPAAAFIQACLTQHVQA